MYFWRLVHTTPEKFEKRCFHSCVICSFNNNVLGKCAYHKVFYIMATKLLWPLQVVNLKIPGLIWRGKAYFVQNNTTIILPDHTRRATSEVPCRTPAVHFGAKLTAWRHKICHIFHFLQSDVVFEIVKHFLCIFNSISSEKRGLLSVPFLTC